MEYIVGIDPGIYGGIAFYTPEQLFAYRTPITEVSFLKKGKKSKRAEMDLDKCKMLIQQHHVEHVFLELVTARPGQGVTGMFRFGQNLGQWEGLVVGLGLPYTFVRPQVWKRKLGLIGAEKGDSIFLARETWPDYGEFFKFKKADEGRAEAALIAKYGWEQVQIYGIHIN